MNFSKNIQDLEKVEDMRTVPALLCTDEKARQYFWNLSVEYTQLINKIIQEITQHQQFQAWLNQGNCPRKTVMSICKSLKANEFTGLPARVYTSAESLVFRTFKAWFELQKVSRLKLKGKQRWLEVIETGLELAKDTNIASESIRARAAAILTKIEVQRSSSNNQQERQGETQKQGNRASQSFKPLMSLLFQKWDTAENSLDRCAIAHLLKNDGQVNQEEEDLDKLALRLEKKRIEIQRLENRLKSRLPTGRDPLGERSQQFLEEAIAFADHYTYIPNCFWLKWHRVILNSQPVDAESLNYWFLGLAYHHWNNTVAFEAWEQDLPRRMANLQTIFPSLPFPLLFGSSTDLHWSWEIVTPATASKTLSLSKAQGVDVNTQATQKPKRRRSRKRQKMSEERICVRFTSKGLNHLQFWLYCDRRHLPIFKQFVDDFQAYKTRSKEDKFSSGLFVLRSACLIWKEDKQALSQKGQNKENHLIEPWNKYRLHLHCAIEPKTLSTEGVEKIRQKKRDESNKKLDDMKTKGELLAQKIEEEQLGDRELELFREYLAAHKALERRQSAFECFKKQLPYTKEIQPKKVVEECKKLEDSRNREKMLRRQIDKKLTLEQQELLRQSIENQEATKRIQSTSDRLKNLSPSRASRPVYQGQSHLVASVCFSRLKVIGVAIIDLQTQEILEYQNLRDLLTDQRTEVLAQRAAKIKGRKRRMIVKHSAEHPAKFRARQKSKDRQKGQRSAVQLGLEQYRLVNRWRNEQRKNLTERKEEQKRGLYAESSKESNQAQYLNRLIARRLIQLCQKWQAGSIILPDFGDLRESMECEIQARAKRKFPDDNVNLQKQYAKNLRMEFHRWGHKGLSQAICSCAASIGVPVRTGRQPRQGTLREKALAMAIAA